MNKALLAPIALAILFTSSFAPTVEAYAFVDAYAVPDTYGAQDRWPGWIGRISSKYFTYDDLPELEAKYLPLALIKTGTFSQMVDQVESTPNVDTTDWPSWIGTLR
tara:strand:- start:106 stop:423 length:318 start_codon:yes stop_codon:yes gene_type:complete